jgi:hypothetical protein
LLISYLKRGLRVEPALLPCSYKAYAGLQLLPSEVLGLTQLCQIYLWFFWVFFILILTTINSDPCCCLFPSATLWSHRPHPLQIAASEGIIFINSCLGKDSPNLKIVLSNVVSPMSKSHIYLLNIQLSHFFLLVKKRLVNTKFLSNVLLLAPKVTY